jgi:hypothetical protein
MRTYLYTYIHTHPKTIHTHTLQAMNKERAMKILKGKLLLIAEEQKAKSIAEIKGDKVLYKQRV